MSLITRLFVASTILLLSSCGGATRWYLNGNSQYQFSVDDAQCQSFASSSYQAQGAYYAGQGLGSGDALTAGLGALMTVFEYGDVNAKYETCMRQRGYTVAN